MGKGSELNQMDVNNAFLHGDLEEDGFCSNNFNNVCQLKKSLYGLNQARR